MYTCPIELSDVRYNAATQSFEAAVTVRDNTTVRTYPCAATAPLSLDFDEAARRLAAEAIRQHQAGGGLFSEVAAWAPVRSAKAKPFARQRWLDKLLLSPMRRVA